MKKPRIVISFTTIPSRYDSLLRSVKSLQQQTYPVDKIYLALPKYSKRLKQEYPPLPNELQELVEVVKMEEDYGPVSKLYGALDREKDPETIIITCDDDTIMPDNFVEEYVKKSEVNPEVCICSIGLLIKYGVYLSAIFSLTHCQNKLTQMFGLKVPNEGRLVDIIFGVGGVLYRRKFFPDREKLKEEFFYLALENEALYYNDDVLISGFLEKQKIKKRLFVDLPVTIDKNEKDALSKYFFAMIRRMNSSIIYLQNNNMLVEPEEVDLSETIVIKLLLLLMVVILIVYIFYILYKNKY